MSHLKERKEKTCLNCQAGPLYGRYCHVCGQENLEPRETVWHLVDHFFKDVTHFDGKFFSTVKYLLKKPGFLSTEYRIGRRASYLNPIRMYVFTSAIFFLIIFSFRSSQKIIVIGENPDKSSEGIPELQRKKAGLVSKLTDKNLDEDDRIDIQNNLKTAELELSSIRRSFGDTSTRKFGEMELASMLVDAYRDSLKKTNLSPAARDTINKAIVALNDERGSNLFGWHQGRFRTIAAYDSAQAELPAPKRDGWIKNRMMKRLISSDQEFRRDKEAYKERFVENYYHSFPKILFLSLPFFALILRLLYIRRKEYLYVDHGIFTIHVYCATFLLMLINVLLSELSNRLAVAWLETVCGWLIFAIVLYMLIYLYWAMLTFYRQGKGKTFLKYVALGILALILNAVLLLLFLLISVISM